MTKKIYYMLTIITVMILFFAKISSSQTTYVELPRTDKLEHNLKGNIVILQIENSNIFGNNNKQQIFLLGKRKNKNSSLMEGIFLLIKEGTEKGYLINLPANTDDDYEIRMDIKDLTGDKIPEILITSNSSGSGEYVNFNVFSAKNRGKELIFNSKINSIKITGKFIDNYRAEITDSSNNQSHLINIFRRRALYLKHKIYNKKCKLIKPVAVHGSAYNLIYPIDIDKDGIFELKGVIPIKGIANYDTIADYEIIWKWTDGNWKKIKSKIVSYRD